MKKLRTPDPKANKRTTKAAERAAKAAEKAAEQARRAAEAEKAAALEAARAAKAQKERERKAEKEKRAEQAREKDRLRQEKLLRQKPKKSLFGDERQAVKSGPQQKGESPRKARKRRGATRLTLSAIMLFQFSACILLVVQHIGELQWAAWAAGLSILLPLSAFLLVWVIAPRLSADLMLTMLMQFLCGLGVVLLFSLDPERGLRQFFLMLGGYAMFAVCTLAVQWIKDWRLPSGIMLPVGVALLILPILFGRETNGAKNWIEIPYISSFQPSELVKIFLILSLAECFSTPRGFMGMLPGLLFAALCLGALMLQKDLGTALMYYLVTLLMFYSASSNLPVTLLGGLGGVGAAVMGYEMFAHVKTRVAIWQNPWSDALGKGYQLVQALTAIASGGLFGVGFGLGKPRVIPAYSTDFIFAVLCEQFGILFGLGVLALYAIIVLRGFGVAVRARTPFLSLTALGVSLLIGLQTFVIIGGVIKLIPLTGITLPFLSYGGTSLVSCMGLVGLLCGVSARGEKDLMADAQMAALPPETVQTPEPGEEGAP